MPGCRSRLTDADFELMADLREAGATQATIGARLGCSEKLVAWHCLRLGIDSPSEAVLREVPDEPVTIIRNGREVRLFTKAEDEKITALALQGHTDVQIARAVGRRNNSIRGRLMTLARREARAEAIAAEYGEASA